MNADDGPLEPDVIVLGTGSLTAPILEAIGADHAIVIVTNDDVGGLVDDDVVVVLEGNPSTDETLERAGIASCNVVIVATDVDQNDALAILSARNLNPSARIVAAATNRENVRKLERAGADEVISPSTIGGGILVDSALSTVPAESRRD